MNNQQALITIGDNINYRVRSTENSADSTGTVSESYDNYSIFIGVLLNITPEITKTNEIILRINPAVSNFKYPEDDGKQVTPREIAPDTSEKKLSTIVKVANGNTIILGGLITRGNSSDQSDVSFLSDIPLLGEAFKSDSTKNITKELIFVITPRIIGAKDDTKATLKDLGFSKRIYDQ
jgi:general secretion pathway protein D